jgi:hypothetical protein
MRQVSPGLFMAPWQDANAAGRLLLTELLTRLPVKGDVIATAPGRDFLFVAGSEDATALGAMVLAIEKAVAQPKSNLPQLLRLDGTKWVPFRLADEHPLAAKHHELVTAALVHDYGHQKKLLDQLHEKNATDLFVADFSVLRRHGESFSFCSWAPCVSLLPRTDLVSIFDGDARLGDGHKPIPVVVPWDDMVAVVGDRLQRDARYRLERYLVAQSPTPDELRALRERAVVLE